MSRVGKNPISLPSGVDAVLGDASLSVKGPQGQLSLDLHPSIGVEQADGTLQVRPQNDQSWAMAGTFRSLIANMVTGVTTGFEKKLEIVGVGYRAQAQGKKLNLSLGFSHPVVYQLPEGVSVETPSQTEIVLKGSDKQQVGQAAAEIRSFRPPEPYKGKGIRYSGEYVVRKQAKKK
ncbi:MAG: 50S ribosomal protein L6 [Proteobacteria bacterium]|jgi:large subunit ribosomal protein L6|nr:50S ribosomal protein L6 [Pseudomonadota bacterium]MBT6349128.1 50S ribosomal protein L6 [Pseudomonadota bacterium]MCH1522040.1 50S ribosomal protein L6 [Arenicellales bacterium]|tara:strand:- start:2990 stop:3517 length:528 start_codon:yes stop_codon:yes gene_type:complete